MSFDFSLFFFGSCDLAPKLKDPLNKDDPLDGITTYTISYGIEKFARKLPPSCSYAESGKCIHELLEPLQEELYSSSSTPTSLRGSISHSIFITVSTHISIQTSPFRPTPHFPSPLFTPSYSSSSPASSAPSPSPSPKTSSAPPRSAPSPDYP